MKTLHWLHPSVMEDRRLSQCVCEFERERGREKLRVLFKSFSLAKIFKILTFCTLNCNSRLQKRKKRKNKQKRIKGKKKRGGDAKGIRKE